MKYSISDTMHVIDTTGKSYGGPYKNADSAKRRIRDLVRKAIVPNYIETPSMPPVEKIAASSAYGTMKKPFPVRQVGCYPAVSKHSYQR